MTDEKNIEYVKNFCNALQDYRFTDDDNEFLGYCKKKELKIVDEKDLDNFIREREKFLFEKSL